MLARPDGEAPFGLCPGLRPGGGLSGVVGGGLGLPSNGTNAFPSEGETGAVGSDVGVGGQTVQSGYCRLRTLLWGTVGERATGSLGPRRDSRHPPPPSHPPPASLTLVLTGQKTLKGT